jgi:hypothetical protein
LHNDFYNYVSRGKHKKSGVSANVIKLNEKQTKEQQGLNTKTPLPFFYAKKSARQQSRLRNPLKRLFKHVKLYYSIDEDNCCAVLYNIYENILTKSVKESILNIAIGGIWRRL